MGKKLKLAGGIASSALFVLSFAPQHLYGFTAGTNDGAEADSRQALPQIDLAIQSSNNFVEIFIAGVGSDAVLRQLRKGNNLLVSVLTKKPLSVRLGAQRLSLPEYGFSDVSLTGNGSTFELILAPEQGLAVPAPIVSNNGRDFILRFPRQNPLMSINNSTFNKNVSGQPQGSPYVPELQMRATAPPVGDMSIGTIVPSYPRVALPGAGKVNRIIYSGSAINLIDSLLKGKGYSFAAMVPESCKQASAPGQQSPALSRSRYCPLPLSLLNISNVTIEEAVNLAIQLSGMQGIVRGRTLIVGRALPMSVKNVLTKAIRVNQVTPLRAATFLQSQGASVPTAAIESQETESGDFEALSLNISGGAGGSSGGGGVSSSSGESSGQSSSGGQTESRKTKVQLDDDSPEVPQVKILDAKDEFYDEDESAVPIISASLVLRGLTVVPDSRSNSLFLTGEPRLLQIAEEFVRRIDIRRRQAAISIQILDVDLANDMTIDNSFSIKTGNSYLISDSGNAILNFGGLTPAQTPMQSAPTLPNPPYPNNVFYNQLEANIQSSSTKVIANPTLIVQEGQTSGVATGRTALTSVNCSSGTGTQGVQGGQPACNPVITTIGLTLNVEVISIDDNGFITMVLDPKLTAPVGITEFDGGTGRNSLVNLAVRQLASGKVRVRDGQTLVLTGIIDDSDRAAATKWPLLGDIPFIGQFFRRSLNDRRKSELVITIKPRLVDDAQGGAYGYGYKPTSLDARKAVYGQ